MALPSVLPRAKHKYALWLAGFSCKKIRYQIFQALQASWSLSYLSSSVIVQEPQRHRNGRVTAETDL